VYVEMPIDAPSSWGRRKERKERKKECWRRCRFLGGLGPERHTDGSSSSTEGVFALSRRAPPPTLARKRESAPSRRPFSFSPFFISPFIGDRHS